MYVIPSTKSAVIVKPSVFFRWARKHQTPPGKNREIFLKALEWKCRVSGRAA